MKMISSKSENETGQVLSEWLIVSSLLTIAGWSAYSSLPWSELNSEHARQIEATLRKSLASLVFIP
jgi:hypothetical protein